MTQPDASSNSYCDAFATFFLRGYQRELTFILLVIIDSSHRVPKPPGPVLLSDPGTWILAYVQTAFRLVWSSLQALVRESVVRMQPQLDNFDDRGATGCSQDWTLYFGRRYQQKMRFSAFYLSIKPSILIN